MVKTANYIITSNTLALIPFNRQTKVIEKENSFYIQNSLNNILKMNFYFHNTTYMDTLRKCVKVLKTKYKVPLVINENIVILPTHSPRNKECLWLVFANILNYHQYLDKTIVEFKNNQKLTINLNYSKLDNQIIKAMRLTNLISKNNHVHNS